MTEKTMMQQRDWTFLYLFTADFQYFFNGNHLTLTNVNWREIAKLQAEMSLVFKKTSELHFMQILPI